MNQKIYHAIATALFLSGSTGLALGAHPDTGPGCGLGKLAWGDYPHQQHILPQVLMSTTNLTFASQTFGISFGTSGCTNDGTMLAHQELNVYVAVNFQNISQEIAQGYGEHLVSLATLMEIPADQHGIFFALAQETYTSLIQDENNTAQALVTALYQLPI